MKPGVRLTFHNDAMDCAIPDWVVDLDSFRRWSDADDFPASSPSAGWEACGST